MFPFVIEKGMPDVYILIYFNHTLIIFGRGHYKFGPHTGNKTNAVWIFSISGHLKLINYLTENKKLWLRSLGYVFLFGKIKWKFGTKIWEITNGQLSANDF